jgi:hypothetical protein
MSLLLILFCRYSNDMITSDRPFRNASQTAIVLELAATAVFVPEW